MSRNQRLDSPTLTWSSLQHLLENALPHVLIILDCCFAANAARDTTDGTAKELLAACGRENPTLGVGIRSFTSALIEELQAFGNKPFSVVMLHARLVTLRWRLAFTPIHTLLSEHGGTSIQLAPLPIVDVSMKPISDQSLEGSERNPVQNISVNTANTPSSPFPPPPPDSRDKSPLIRVSCQGFLLRSRAMGDLADESNSFGCYQCRRTAGVCLRQSLHPVCRLPTNVCLGSAPRKGRVSIRWLHQVRKSPFKQSSQCRFYHASFAKAKEYSA